MPAGGYLGPVAWHERGGNDEPSCRLLLPGANVGDPHGQRVDLALPLEQPVLARVGREQREALARHHVAAGRHDARAGGKVVAPDVLPSLLEAFGEGRRVVQERREYALWNNPYVLLLLALLLTAEWLLRKKGGLA